MLLYNNLHMRYSADGRKLRRRIYLIGAAFLLFPWVPCVLQNGTWQSAIPGVVIGVMILAGMPYLTRRGVRKAYARKPDRDLAVTYELSADRLKFHTELMTVESPWNAICSVIRRPEGFYCISQKGNFTGCLLTDFQTPKRWNNLPSLLE
jgi:hypothetical protein